MQDLISASQSSPPSSDLITHHASLRNAFRIKSHKSLQCPQKIDNDTLHRLSLQTHNGIPSALNSVHTAASPHLPHRAPMSPQPTTTPRLSSTLFLRTPPPVAHTNSIHGHMSITYVPMRPHTPKSRNRSEDATSTHDAVLRATRPHQHRKR